MKTFISILLLSILSFPVSAADCTSPHGVESQTRFDAGIMYYCNGTNWIRMDTPPGAGGLGCIVGNIAIPPGGSGTFYSATSHADCASISEVRTCTNGALSGSFTHTGCTPIVGDPCETGPIGTVCTSDGAIYIGDGSGGARIYARATDSSAAVQWKVSNTDTSGTLNPEYGAPNTDAMIADSNSSHPVATLCRSHGAQWYVPAKEELNLIWQNRTANGGPLNLAGIGIHTAGGDYYWASTQYDAYNAWIQMFGSGLQTGNNKSGSHRVRCVRR